MLNWYEMFVQVLRMIYYWDIINAKLLQNVEWVLRLVSANGILEGLPGCNWWLALANDISERLLGCD